MKTVVHRFRISDSEDPEMYASEPLWQWQQTEQGKWVLAHSAQEPYFNIRLDPEHYSYECIIVADLVNHDLTYFNLRWGNK